MFQLPPGMSYKQFQAAGSPGYRSDILPWSNRPPIKEGGSTNSAGGSVRQPSRYGYEQPMQPQGRGTPYPGGPAGILAPGTAPGTSDAPWYDAPFAVLKSYAPAQPKAPSMPRYDQAQPMQPPSQGTPYGADTPQQPFDQNRWRTDLTGTGPAGDGFHYADGTPIRMEKKSAWQYADGTPKRMEQLKRMEQQSAPTDPKYNHPGQQPWSGSPMGGPLDNGIKSFGGGQYTNGQGQGFMGSMSFAPGTSDAYRNQAYGNWANSQGYFQQPSQGTPYGADTPQPTAAPYDPWRSVVRMVNGRAVG